jgi:hypothetical protein
MWTSVALAVSLLSAAPAADAKLGISNARFTYGPFGMERTDTDFLPGDVAFLAYDIENATMDAKTGKVVYGLVLRLTDSKDKLVYERENRRIEALNALNSPIQPAYATVEIGADQPPGNYVLKLTVTDHVTKKKAEYTKKFKVLKKAFGFTRIQAPVANLVGPGFGMNFTVVGFQRDSKKYPRVTVSLLILDEDGKSTLIRPITMNIPKDLPEDVKAEDIRPELGFPVQFPLNRAGKFTIRVTATDELAKKTVKMDYKIWVLDPKKFESGK